MLFIFHGVPQAQPTDLSKSFDSLQTTPDVSAKAQEISKLRNNFYATLGQVTTKPLNEIIQDLDWMPLISYLNIGPDLLELGVKKANYPFIFNYQPFSFSERVVTANNDNEVAATMEMIFSRYLYSLGMLRSSSGWIGELRKAKREGNDDRCGEIVKAIMERVSNGAVRLIKMKASQRFLFPGLKGREDVPEFTTDFLQIMISVFEVNFASLFLEKLFLNQANPSGIKFAASIALQSIRKVERVEEGFKRFNCNISLLVRAWSGIAKLHFQILAYWSMYLENEFMTSKIIEKTKDVETIYFQNNLLANKILDLKQSLESLSQGIGANDLFNLRESAMHSLAFINQAQEYQLKKAITTFENIKGDLNLRQFTGVTAESLFSQIDNTVDRIEQHLLKSAGLV